MKIYEILINEVGVEPIPSIPGSYRVVYPPEYNMPPEGPLSKYEAEKKLSDAEIKFRNKRAQDYLDQKEAEKNPPKTSQPTAPKSEPDKPSADSDKGKKKKKDKKDKKDKPQEAPSSLWQKAQQRYKSNAAFVEAAEKKYMSRYGMKINLAFRAWGLYEVIRDQWGILDSLEDMYQNDTMDSERYEETREYAWGLFNTAVIVPWVTKALANAAMATKLARIIKNTFAFFSSWATLGGSIAAAIATEVFFVWFQKWLMGPAGQKWLSLYTYQFIVYFGKPTDLAATELITAYKQHISGQDTSGDYYTDAEERKLAKEKSKGTSSDRPQSTDGEQTDQDPLKRKKFTPPKLPDTKAAWPTHIRDVYLGYLYVGGRRVTDENGILIPGIEKQDKINVARIAAKDLNLPDPLADIPRQPGQTLAPIF